MIVVRLYGGLAGQMTQYAVGRRMSLDRGTRLYVDASWYRAQGRDSRYPRRFQLDRLGVRLRFVDHDAWRWRLRLGRRWRSLNPFALEHVREQDYSRFDPAVLSVHGGAILDGYWPSYRYFDSIRDVLVEELHPREKPTADTAALLDEIARPASVAVHFRRGDYTLSDFHGLLGPAYYERALAAIRRAVPEPRLFLFSDDPEWVAEKVTFPVPYVVVDQNRDDEIWDFELMRHCKHHIVANSGFSWWAAWLNPNPEKIVVAPSTWIAQGDQTLDDLIPSQWTRIESDFGSQWSRP